MPTQAVYKGMAGWDNCFHSWFEQVHIRSPAPLAEGPRAGGTSSGPWLGRAGGFPIMGLIWLQQFTCNQTKEKLPGGFRRVTGPIEWESERPWPYYGGPSPEPLPSSLADSWCRPFLHHMTMNQTRSFREEGLILAQGLRV